MPAVPKRRTSQGRRDRRRASSYPRPIVPTMVQCDCGELVRPYHVCPSCGSYRGRQVFEVKES